MSSELRPRRRSLWRSFGRGVKRLRKNSFVSLVLDVVIILGTALVLSVLIKAFLIRSFFIPSGSMLETLQINDRIIVNVMVPQIIEVNRGDVVVFQDPGGWLGPVRDNDREWYEELGDFVLGSFGITAPDSDEHLVKRVIGMPGDTVVCCDENGLLQINGVSINEVYLPNGAEPSNMEFSVTVPEDSFWVMGDNRGNSQDSRYHTSLPGGGFVHKDFLVGRAFVVSWPAENWNWLDNFSEVFDDVPKP
jgi:signal peptidase I